MQDIVDPLTESAWRREKRVNFHKPTIFVYLRKGSSLLTVLVLVKRKA